ncbi:hypothetical protein [Rhizobium sp. CCGE 510]|uniref:hypothetical protein n=1 Tax=Rhizobium sp. CCGE 510 TaxID=1132836 RepID=UPI00027B7E7D|nr:hypothetical protein [Rhizobium sp. CCGE 510]EJT04957.1 hypothetical protein RCCGE510_12516 [Rhizobium sp. CCGE 510]
MARKKEPFNRRRFETMFPENRDEMTAEEIYRRDVAAWNRAIDEANRLSGSLRSLGHDGAAFLIEKAWRLLRESPPAAPKPPKVEKPRKPAVKQLMKANRPTPKSSKRQAD